MEKELGELIEEGSPVVIVRLSGIELVRKTQTQMVGRIQACGL
jgi:hypothetical protein